MCFGLDASPRLTAPPYCTSQLQHDKITLENQLEAEQEFIVNKMQRKIDQAEAETMCV